ncbi:DUF255 domain-containing protein [Aliiglaciecola sp. NS0011-25]|uniref:DUF255 domain-containing protein n=1 Tax=Aliiglaciecola sp. NS0011-25 TaxID=3127654 RepID=UPI003108EF7B
MIQLLRIVTLALILNPFLFAFATDKSAEQWFELRKSWLEELQIITVDEKPLNINQLIKEDSPYLLRHSVQAIDWFAWTDPAFEVAQDQNKLVYLSIGYETCHWCHVISDESYDDPQIVSLLNDNFVSIKLDREQYPDVDNKYHRALSKVIETPGWPIQVILTPNGHILWIDSYTKPKSLYKTLNVLAKKWQASSQSMSELAESRHHQLLPSYTPDLKRVSSTEISSKKTQMLADIRTILKREQQGNGPRFLRANWLLYLLDELQSGDLQIVEKQVNQLLTSPTYDFVDGGMHRYAEDGSWEQPHFEKMLYDQGQLIRVLNRLYLITQKQVYVDFAYQIIHFVESNFKHTDLYSSSISAISNGIEGEYYRYPNYSKFSNSELSANLNVKNGLLSLRNLSLPNQHIRQLKALKNSKNKPTVDDKSILAWSAIYLLSVTELYQTTNDILLRDIVTIGATELIQGHYQNDQLFRIQFRGNTSIAATFNDFAWAILLFNELYLTFSDEEYADFVGEIQKPFLVKINDSSWDDLSTDSEMPSALGMTLMALSKLKDFNLMKESKSLPLLTADIRNANLDAASVVLAWQQKKNSLSRLSSFFARGKGVALIKRSVDGGNLYLKMQDGWHINAHTLLDSKLIPTELSPLIKNTDFEVVYPQGELRKLGFSEKKMLIYEHQVVIPFSAKRIPNRANELKVKVQACSDTICLLPEEIKLIY